MEAMTALASTVVSIIFTEAVKKQGEALGKLTTEKIVGLKNVVRAKFQQEEIGGVLKRAEENPDQKNLDKVQEELVSVMEMEKNADFTKKVQYLVEEMKKQGLINDSNTGNTQSKFNLSIKEVKGSGIGDGNKIENKW